MMSQHALICSYYMPQPDVDSYSRRLFHFIEFLKKADWQVTCVARNPQGVEQFAQLLEDQGVSVFVGHAEHVERLATSEHFDVGILGFWHIAEPLIPVLRQCSPATRLIVDSGDLYFLRHARRILQESDGGLGMLSTEYAAETVRELNVYAAADGVLAVSRKEAGLIADFMGDSSHSFTVADCDDLAPSPLAFAKRRGMFFVGNFEHLPNAEAVRYLCEEILPHLDPGLLAEHPIYIAGNAMTPAIRQLAHGWPAVRMLGWVPSVVPYLERVRLSLIPLLHGAGTKRKMIQSLSIGTPTVTTSVGIEGFDLRHEEEVLVADDPLTFAASIARLLADHDLWDRLATQGRTRIRLENSQEVAQAQLLAAIAAIQRPTRRQTKLKSTSSSGHMSQRDYQVTIENVRDQIRQFTPPGSTIAVVSKGDEALLTIDGRTCWHFPRADDGGFAGFYPGTDGEVVNHLESLREQGADFFALPRSAFWWMTHYPDFRGHLLSRYRRTGADGQHCLLFSLRESPIGPQSLELLSGAAATDESVAGTDDAAPLAFAGLTELHAVRRYGEGVRPAISIVIPTRNRAALLAQSLASLASQVVDGEAFEVIVVNDGSTDDTPDVCRRLSERLRLTVIDSAPSGIAVAKNLGVDAAAAPLVLFFDDDDVADRTLVAEHLTTHRQYPLEQVAVLGFTNWDKRLPQSEVMRFVTDVGHYLFSYTHLRHMQQLDSSYFWGGRSSCKKSLLVRAGGFRQDFTFGSEDIEAGYRMSRLLIQERLEAQGPDDRLTAAVRRHAERAALTVVYNRRAIQHMIRPLTYDEFCGRCERQGRSQLQFSRFYADPAVAKWCGTGEAELRWHGLRDALPALVARVHELEPLLQDNLPPSARAALVKELHGLYWMTFDAFKLKGIVEAAAVLPKDIEQIRQRNGHTAASSLPAERAGHA